MVIADVILPANFVDGEAIVRIDCYFSLIFKEDDSISNIDAKVVSRWDIWKTLSKYSLTFNIRKSKIAFPTRPLLSIVYTDCLQAESTLIAVSGELLSLHSDYFTNIFYGPYLERSQEVKQMSDVSEVEFAEFMHWIHTRNGQFNSVKNVMDAIIYSDRFSMLFAIREALPQLMRLKCPSDHLDYALILADRVSSCPDLISWILSQFTSKIRLLETVEQALPNISTLTAQICIRAMKSAEMMNNLPDYSALRNLIPHNDFGEHLVGIHLMFYNSNRKNIEKSDFTTTEVMHYPGSGPRVKLNANEPDTMSPYGREQFLDMRIVWKKIPEAYSRLVFDGTNQSIQRVVDSRVSERKNFERRDDSMSSGISRGMLSRGGRGYHAPSPQPLVQLPSQPNSAQLQPETIVIEANVGDVIPCRVYRD